MTDLLSGQCSLKDFSGIVFVGGFSYADVLDSAKGWAATIKFNSQLLEQFEDFYSRDDTFSLGVCNGCQLMALLGWVPGRDLTSQNEPLSDIEQPRFIHNKSGRFESRFVMVKIQESPAIMLDGMAGSQLGVWCAHGEGQVWIKSLDLLVLATEETGPFTFTSQTRPTSDSMRCCSCRPISPKTASKTPY